MADHVAVSPAGNAWQRACIGGLRQISVPVIGIGHIPEPAWPRGKLRGIPKSSDSYHPHSHLVSFLNCAGIRDILIARSYGVSFDRVVNDHGRPVAIVSYNASCAVSAWALRQQTLHAIPWISILADISSNVIVRVATEGLSKLAWGRVYLSWHRFQGSSHRNKLHVDGGVSHLQTRRQDRYSGIEIPRGILYSGALNEYGGVRALINAFTIDLAGRNDIELWICGKPSAGLLDTHGDDRIKVFGYLSDRELDELSSRASIFVNPRPMSIAGNNDNFPSKILRYLSYCKPVVSTWTGGLSPDYRKILFVTLDDSPSSVARAIERALLLSPDRNTELEREISTFLSAGRFWSQQACKLKSWIANEMCLDCWR